MNPELERLLARLNEITEKGAAEVEKMQAEIRELNASITRLRAEARKAEAAGRAGRDIGQAGERIDAETRLASEILSDMRKTAEGVGAELGAVADAGRGVLVPEPIPRAAVESDLLNSVGYDPTRRILEVEFKKGDVYRYQNVPEELYLRIMQEGESVRGGSETASVGRLFLTEIRAKPKEYPFQRMTPLRKLAPPPAPGTVPLAPGWTRNPFDRPGYEFKTYAERHYGDSPNRLSLTVQGSDPRRLTAQERLEGGAFEWKVQREQAEGPYTLWRGFGEGSYGRTGTAEEAIAAAEAYAKKVRSVPEPSRVIQHPSGMEIEVIPLRTEEGALAYYGWEVRIPEGEGRSRLLQAHSLPAFTKEQALRDASLWATLEANRRRFGKFMK